MLFSSIPIVLSLLKSSLIANILQSPISMWVYHPQVDQIGNDIPDVTTQSSSS